MKGSAITGPVGKEAAELWPVSHPSSSSLVYQLVGKNMLISYLAYCLQLRCCHVKCVKPGIRSKKEKKAIPRASRTKGVVPVFFF